MKSRFAKFTDKALGAALIFFAATAALRYYTTLEMSVFCAVAITAAAAAILSAKQKAEGIERELSQKTRDMFFELMFDGDVGAARRLFRALKAREPSAAMHGAGVYVGRTAAFCCIERQADAEHAARLVRRAERYGAGRLALLCKLPPPSRLELADMRVMYVCGDDVYKLFASLGALPENKHQKPKAAARFAGALGKEKILRYAMLSAALFAIWALTGSAYVSLACAILCAALAVAAMAVNAKRALTKNKDARTN